MLVICICQEVGNRPEFSSYIWRHRKFFYVFKIWRNFLKNTVNLNRVCHKMQMLNVVE